MIITNKIKLYPLPSAVVSFRFASVCLYVHHRAHGFREGVGVRGRDPRAPSPGNSFISVVNLPKIHRGSQCPHRHVNGLTHCASLVLLGNIILGDIIIFILYCLFQ